MLVDQFSQFVTDNGPNIEFEASGSQGAKL